MKLSFLLPVLACLAGSVPALAEKSSRVGENDVNVALPSEFRKYKLTSTGAKLSFVTWSFYFLPSGDIKAKAEGTVKLYLSDDGTPEESELFLTKNIKGIKMSVFPKKVKAKLNLAASDKGRYIIATIDSPQDQYFANNQASFQILF